MIIKEKLAEIVRKAVEDAWYNRRSVNPVEEQTELITNLIFDELQRIEKEAVNPFHNGDPDCQICRGTGSYYIGGSFGGGVTTLKCNCKKPNKMDKISENKLVSDASELTSGDEIKPVVENVGQEFMGWAERYWKLDVIIINSLINNVNVGGENCPYSYLRDVFVNKINELVDNKKNG